MCTASSDYEHARRPPLSSLTALEYYKRKGKAGSLQDQACSSFKPEDKNVLVIMKP